MAQIGCGVAQIECDVAQTGCGVAQIGLGVAKYWLRQNTDVDKILALTKYWH